MDQEKNAQWLELQKILGQTHAVRRVATLMHLTVDQACKALERGEQDEMDRLVGVAQRLQRELSEELSEWKTERPTNQTPVPPEAIEQFREQLAARPLPELAELGAYEPKLPELATLERLEELHGTITPEELRELKEKQLQDPAQTQQEGEPITKKDPAETASGEPPENA